MSDGHPNPERKSGVTAGREQRARDAASALRDYQADRLAVEDKTARLRALRLARDAAAQTAAAAKPAKPAKKRVKRTST